MVKHDILMVKLENFEFNCFMNDFLNSFLIQRSQCVHVNDYTSTVLYIGLGVPRGSV